MGEEGNLNNDGRVAVITDSSKGIGKAIAMEFARAGYFIVMNARHEQQLKQTAEEISNSIEKIVSPAGVSQLLENQQEREKKEQQIPLHRIGSPEEIAKVALFF